MQQISGEILTLEGFRSGCISFDDRHVDIHFSSKLYSKKPTLDKIILPTLINAHTHIGDAFIRDKKMDLPRTVQELVRPPTGLKHRLLHAASDQEILQGMISSIAMMDACGTTLFCDFREQGLHGVTLLKKAMSDFSVCSLILSRPRRMVYDEQELIKLLQNSDGIGLSGILDWEYAEVQKIAGLVRRKNKIFALHASEVQRENIDQILDLHPHFLVHMAHATESDLVRVQQENIPVVICPRSNDFFGIKRDWSLLKKTKVLVMLGTDNAMIANPDVLDEIRFLYQTNTDFSLHELLAMATYTPRKALNLEDDIHAPNSLGNFIILDRDTMRPIYRVLREKRG
ncbi:MAG: amidohydrolase family protein [Candidatus Thermoplasmatota archaeon]